MNNIGKAWDSQQDSELISLIGQKLQMSEIASRMGRTMPGIEARIDRLRRDPVGKLINKMFRK